MTRMSRPGRPGGCGMSGWRGFTLIELLVVVAIVAVLIALALPVIGRLRAGAETTGSLSNLRQVHVLLMNYVNENNYMFPSALGSTADDPAARYHWRRVIWESANGAFEGDVVAQMQSSEYADVMWCPLMVSRHGQQQHPWGRGSYAINFFFIDSTWRLGDDYRNLVRADMKGKREPLIMTGSLLDSNPEFGTWEAIQSSSYPYDTDWMNLHYAYGSGEDQALAVFLDGHTEMIGIERGSALDPLLANPADFE